MNKYHLITVILFITLSTMINAQLQPGKTFIADNFHQSTTTLNNTLERRGAWPYGSSIAIAVDSLRDIIFLGSGGAVLILDGSDKNNPTLITDDVRSHGLVEDIFYDDQTQRLYLACGDGGFEIWDASTPSNPQFMSRMEILYFDVETPVGHVQVSGNYAILECGFGYVHSVDVSDPNNPVQVAFNGIMGNPAYDIHLGTDGRIHATGQQFYVRLNVMSDGSLNSAGGHEFIFGSGAVFGKDEIAFVSYSGNMYILDLNAPGFPAWSITDVGGIGHIEVRGSYAYIVNDDGLQIWDVSNVQTPVLQSTFLEDYNFDDLYVAGDYAYIGGSYTGLRIFDIKDPTNPIEMGTYGTFSIARGLDIVGDIAYLGDGYDGLLMIDKSNLDYPEVMGQYEIPTGFMYQVEVRNGIAYTVCYDGGFRIVDVSDPANPIELGFDDTYNVWKLDVHGDYAYVVEPIPNAVSYVHIYDVSEPSNPMELSSTEFPTTVYEVLYNNGYLYVANEDNGLRILDVSDPVNPVEVASMSYPDAFDSDIIGNVLYLCAPGIAQPDGGFYTIDITNPENPVELDEFSPNFMAFFTVKAEGDYAYITDADDVHILDISNPNAITYLEEYRMPDFAFDADVQNGLLYISNARAGLQILNNMQFIPVELVSFTADVKDGKVILEWTTATETNNNGFEIQKSEKSSIKGQYNWQKIGFVEGKGTTTEEQSYSFVDNDLTNGKDLYRLKQVDYDGSFEFSNVVEVEILTPIEFSLAHNYPNPFNPSTTIEYSIPNDGNVKLEIFNTLGEEVTTLVNHYKEAGIYTINFDASELPSGIYYYRLETAAFTSMKKMILLK